MASRDLPGAPPAANDYGAALRLGFTGAVVGCIFIGLVTGVCGVWPLFFAIPAFLVHLVLSALLGAAITAMAARFCKRPLSNAAIMAAGAVLTVLLFGVLPLYFMLFVPARDARMLLG
ncbi:MAG: hypothetical protein JO032_10935 [Alphaproteobacteria bacterium]|nr:hypothetical protein [Alphaproteobacteria bacterium]